MKRVIVLSLALVMVTSALALADSLGAFSAFRHAFDPDQTIACLSSPDGESQLLTRLFTLDDVLAACANFGVPSVDGLDQFYSECLIYRMMDGVFTEATDQFDLITLLGLNESVRLEASASDCLELLEQIVRVPIFDDYVPYMEFVSAPVVVQYNFEDAVCATHFDSASAFSDYYNFKESAVINGMNGMKNSAELEGNLGRQFWVRTYSHEVLLIR